VSKRFQPVHDAKTTLLGRYDGHNNVVITS